MRAAAENLTPVTLELGGKSPVIIARDADLKNAAVRIMTGKALNSGQACLGPDYVMVANDQLAEFIRLATEWTGEMFPTLLGNVDCCSVINEQHFNRLRSYLAEAASAGVAVRQVNPAGESFEGQEAAYKIPFTFVINPGEDLKVMQEEIFGPVLVMIRYQDEDDAIRIANDTEFGLASYFYARDLGRVWRVAEALEYGMVAINEGILSSEVAPVGGVKESGPGREGSK